MQKIYIPNTQTKNQSKTFFNATKNLNKITATCLSDFFQNYWNRTIIAQASTQAVKFITATFNKIKIILFDFGIFLIKG